MTDRQGRGSDWDESRIERHNQRPLETGPDVSTEVHRILENRTMSNPQNLADQLGWCNSTRHYLEDLQHDIQHVARQYFETVETLKGDQYLQELWVRLLPLRDEFNTRAEHTFRHIDDVHIDYVNQQADSVSNQLSVIMGLPKPF